MISSRKRFVFLFCMVCIGGTMTFCGDNLVPDPRPCSTDKDCQADMTCVEGLCKAKLSEPEEWEQIIRPEPTVSESTGEQNQDAKEGQTENIGDAGSEDVPEKTSEPAVEKPVEPSPEKTTEPVAEKKSEPVSEPAAEKTAEPAKEQVAEPTAEKTAEPAKEIPPESGGEATTSDAGAGKETSPETTPDD
ncbi:MAG TPA: hypothetical protein DCE42_07065 [Myxococcales bacterium]|nr:hypothetical protein [Deltaproteobacteria bacterium]MBU50857.1 hypothetical protein [Deltaproteobacteria bacterium]HAA54499.1 hypothetical protein [Myxococcales bacterium]